MLLKLLDAGVGLFEMAFAELNLQVVEFYLLVDGVKLAVVAYVVLLLLVFFDQLSMLGNLFLLDGAFLVGGFNLALEIVDAGLQTGYLILQILNGLRQLTTDNLDFVNLGVDTLERVQCHQAFFDDFVDVNQTVDFNGVFFLLDFSFRCDFFRHFIYYFYSFYPYKRPKKQ